MGMVPPANIPLPVPVILAPGAPLPVAVAPVPPHTVPLAAAPVVSSASAPLKNGFVSGTPPPHESSSSGAAASSAAPSSQQQTHAQTHHQPRFLYAAPTPGAPYGAQPQLQLYAFHPPTSFYTPTLLQVWLLACLLPLSTLLLYLLNMMIMLSIAGVAIYDGSWSSFLRPGLCVHDERTVAPGNVQAFTQPALPHERPGPGTPTQRVTQHHVIFWRQQRERGGVGFVDTVQLRPAAGGR